MHELKLIITLPSFEIIIPEGKLTFHYLEQCIFQLTKTIGQYILTEIRKFLDNKLKKEKEGNSQTVVNAVNTFLPSWVISAMIRISTRIKKAIATIF